MSHIKLPEKVGEYHLKFQVDALDYLTIEEFIEQLLKKLQMENLEEMYNCADDITYCDIGCYTKGGYGENLMDLYIAVSINEVNRPGEEEYVAYGIEFYMHEIATDIKYSVDFVEGFEEELILKKLVELLTTKTLAEWSFGTK